MKKKRKNIRSAVTALLLIAVLAIPSAVSVRAMDTKKDPIAGGAAEVYQSADDTKTYAKCDGSMDETAAGIQEQIDTLPDIKGFDSLTNDEKDAKKAEMKELYAAYMALSRSQRMAVDASRLFSTYLYSESLVYAPNEDDNEKYTLDDISYVTLSDEEKERFSSDLDSLPALYNVTDVNSIVLTEDGELTGNDICFTDEGASTFLSPAKIDALFDKVLDLSILYFTVDREQAGEFDYSRLQPLLYYFTSGINAYPRDVKEEDPSIPESLGLVMNAEAASSVGSITGYYTVNYSGDLTSRNPRCGVYTVSTNATGHRYTYAFCMQSSMNAPGGVGTNLTYENVVTNNVIKTILYYGFGGPGEMVDHDNNGYCETHYAIDWALNGSNSTNKTLAQAAYNLLYTNRDKSVASKVHAYYTGTGSSGAQQLVYASYFETTQNPIYQSTKYTAREALSPSLDIHIEKADADTGEKLAGAEFTVYMDGKKAGTVTTDEKGKGAYHWRGSAIYTAYQTSSAKRYCVNYDNLSAANKQAVNNNSAIYNNLSTAYNAAKNEVIAKANQALETLKTNTKHTWKVVETKAPAGYELNELYFEQTLDANVTAIEVDFTNVARSAYLKLQKSSGNASLTDGNDCYSLAGAEYGVYASEEDAKKDTDRVATLTTDENGNTDAAEVAVGEYWIKEVAASRGYMLCDGTDGAKDGIHYIYVETPGETYSVACAEPPANDSFSLILQKMDHDTGKPTAQGIASLKGAIFELTYYTNTDGTVSELPFKKWYFKTDENGYFDCSNAKYLLSAHTMKDGTVLSSDELFKDPANNIVYLLGTYQIREVVPPLYYQNAGYMKFHDDFNKKADVTEGLKMVLKQDENGKRPSIYDGDDLADGKMMAENLAINAYDTPEYGSITIYKRKADGSKAPLPGVTFKLAGSEEGDEYTATTDQDGRIVWDGLVAQNYIITEIKTADGLNLLKDNIEVTLPMEMTLDEIKKNGAAIDQAVYDEAAGTYCFYDLSFTIDNSATLDMPFTGGEQTRLYIILAIGIAIVAVGMGCCFRRRI